MNNTTALAMCQGKVTFVTALAAYTVKDRTRDTRTVYRCRCCHQYHLGHGAGDFDNSTRDRRFQYRKQNTRAKHARRYH